MATETPLLASKMIQVRLLRADPGNVRDDLGDLTELGRSMVEQGVLQPLLVQPCEAGHAFMVIDGHRRYAAAVRVGMMSLPCLITSRKTASRAVLTMLAAAMHKALTPLEQATAFTRLIQDEGLSISDVSRSTGYSAATIRARMSLENLPPEVKTMVADKTMGLGAATNLARQVRRTRTGGVQNTLTKSPFSPAHPLAAEVRSLCEHEKVRVQVGGVGCGQCWEEAIRADERETYAVDDQAIARALSGDRSVTLNPAERHRAVLELLDKGKSVAEVALVLGTTKRLVERVKERQTQAFAENVS